VTANETLFNEESSWRIEQGDKMYRCERKEKTGCAKIWVKDSLILKRKG